MLHAVIISKLANNGITRISFLLCTVLSPEFRSHSYKRDSSGGSCISTLESRFCALNLAEISKLLEMRLVLCLFTVDLFFLKKETSKMYVALGEPERVASCFGQLAYVERIREDWVISAV